MFQLAFESKNFVKLMHSSVCTFDLKVLNKCTCDYVIYNKKHIFGVPPIPGTELAPKSLGIS